MDRYGNRRVVDKPAPAFVVSKWVSQPPAVEGKMKFIFFWATWCPHCVEEIPHLNAWHKKYGDRLAIIGITPEPAHQVAAMKSPKIEYAVASDAKTFSKLGVQAIPNIFVIDPSGVIRWQGLGWALQEADLEALLDKYASATPADELPADPEVAADTSTEPGGGAVEAFK